MAAQRKLDLWRILQAHADLVLLPDEPFNENFVDWSPDNPDFLARACDIEALDRVAPPHITRALEEDIGVLLAGNRDGNCRCPADVRAVRGSQDVTRVRYYGPIFGEHLLDALILNRH
jgi:hypothetical protein